MNAPLHLLMEAESPGPARLPRPQTDPDLPVYSALTLTNGGNMAQIVLTDMVYTLRVTRAGKLILTK